METITLAAYLEKNDSEKITKSLTRAVQTYRHALKDIAHAAADIEHAKEDCRFALQGYEQLLDDCHSHINDWIKGDDLEEEQALLAEEGPSDAGETGDEEESSVVFELEEEEEDEEFDEQNVLEQVEVHLEHAAKDCVKAIEDADNALDGLDEIDHLLFEIIGEAEDQGLLISLAEARAHIAAKAGEKCSGQSAAVVEEAVGAA